jgi:hypothetical protein
MPKICVYLNNQESEDIITSLGCKIQKLADAGDMVAAQRVINLARKITLILADETTQKEKIRNWVKEHTFVE